MLYTYTIFVVCCSVLLTLLTYMVLLPVYVSVRGKHVPTLSTYTPISCCVSALALHYVPTWYHSKIMLCMSVLALPYR